MPNAIPGPGDIVRRELPNGIVALARENFDAGSVVVAGSFAAGAVYEASDKAGLAGLTAEALLRGTERYPFSQLHETLESSGMSLDVDGGRYLASFSGKALAEDLPRLLELLGEVLRRPVFPAGHVDLLKGEAITSLRYNLQNSRYMAAQTWAKLAYPDDHILARDADGTPESIEALTAEDLRAFHQAQYGPGRMVVAMVGAVPAEQAIQHLETALGDWENPQQQIAPDQPSLPALDSIRHQLHVLPGKTQSDIVLGVPGPARTAADFDAARMVNNVLGVFGMMGRLGANVREKQGLAYYSYSNLAGGLGPGPWRVAAGVSPANVKQAVVSIRHEVERILNEPVSEDDLADNVANFTGRLPLMLESNAGVAGNLLNMERYGLGLDYLQRYAERLHALTVADLQAAMQHYWRADAFAVAVAGPTLDEDFI